MKLLKAEWEVNQQEWGEECKCYCEWWWLCWIQTSSWGQRRVETQEDRCQTPAVQQKTGEVDWQLDDTEWPRPSRNYSLMIGTRHLMKLLQQVLQLVASVKEVMFYLQFFCLSVCYQDRATSCWQILMNFFGSVQCTTSENWLDSGNDLAAYITLGLVRIGYGW